VGGGGRHWASDGWPKTGGGCTRRGARPPAHRRCGHSSVPTLGCSNILTAGVGVEHPWASRRVSAEAHRPNSKRNKKRGTPKKKTRVAKPTQAPPHRRRTQPGAPLWGQQPHTMTHSPDHGPPGQRGSVGSVHRGLVARACVAKIGGRCCLGSLPVGDGWPRRPHRPARQRRCEPEPAHPHTSEHT
jgi:hypothetical protein